MGLLIRLLLIALVAWAVYRLVRRLLGPGAAPTAPDAPPPANQVMRRCAHCGVHVPEGESTQSAGQFFCSEAHRDAWRRQHG
ncbi:MAG: PP0621 family protein [Moraxellaceae bacterium]